MKSNTIYRLTQLWLLYYCAMSDTASARPIFPSVLYLAELNNSTGFRIDGVETSQGGNTHAVASAGDINGDGVNDLIIGEPWAKREAGSSYVIYGQQGGLSNPFSLANLTTTTGFRLDGEMRDEESSYSVASAGDINNDGVDDLIIRGARTASSYVVYGQPGGLSHPFPLVNLTKASGFRIVNEYSEAESRCSIARAGDVNGDSVDDLIIGVPEAAPNGQSHAGSSYVVYGQPGGLPHPFLLTSLNRTTGFRIDGEKRVDHSGHCVAGAGDINGDGLDDIIIGAPDADPNGQDRAGSSYVIYGQPGGLPHPFALVSLTKATGFRLDGEEPGHSSGTSVASAGDINGDGVDDLIIGAPGAGLSRAGSSYVIYGQPGGLPHPFPLASLTTATGFRIDGEANYDYSGESVASIGDINGDNLDDLIIGAPESDSRDRGNAGNSYVVYGQPGGLAHPFSLANLTSATGFRIQGEEGTEDSGSSVASAGDINGDGVNDLIIAASKRSRVTMSTGTSYVVYGRRQHAPHTPSLSTSSISLTTVSASNRITALKYTPSSDAPDTTISFSNVKPTATSMRGSTDSLSSDINSTNQTTMSKRITTTAQQPSSDVSGVTKSGVSSSDSSNTAILVGSIVGGVVIVSSLAAVSIFACRKKTAKQPNRQQQASSEMTAISPAQPATSGRYANISDASPTGSPYLSAQAAAQVLQEGAEYAHASKLRDSQLHQQGYQDTSSIKNPSRYAGFNNIPSAVSPYLNKEAAAQVLQEGAQYAQASNARNAQHAQQGYDDIPMPNSFR